MAEPAFYVCFVHDMTKHFVMIGVASSLEEAKGVRQVGGDLVFGPDGEVDQSQEWFWEWEKKGSCYAKQAQKELKGPLGAVVEKKPIRWWNPDTRHGDRVSRQVGLLGRLRKGLQRTQ